MNHHQKTNPSHKTALRQALTCSLISAIFTLGLASPAHASAMQFALCTVLGFVQGPLGDGAATIGVMSVGVGAVMGKVSMGMAITVAVGISILFGAINLAGTILGVDPSSIC